jgi:LysM repeat protein
MKNKGSTPSMLAAYRRRQERAARMLLFFWVGIMLLILGAGYLIYRFLKPGKSPQALTASGTPGLTGTFLPSASASNTTTLAPTTTQTPDQTLVPTGVAALPTPSYVTYTVKEGETLIGIAVGLGVNLPTLIALNPSITPELIKVGDQLTVPGHGNNLTDTPPPPGSQSIVEYRVVAGDTLAGIAARFGSSIGAIVRENNLASPDQIQEGQTLRIPVTANTPSPAVPDTVTVTPTPQG